MNNALYDRLKTILPETNILLQEPLSAHTTFHIGGPADYFLTIHTEEELVTALTCVQDEGVPYFVIGKGSNLLVSDEGFRGAVLKIQGLQQDALPTEPGQVYATAGETLTQVAHHAMLAGLGGLEFAVGIPGSIGGAIYMNAGAYGGEMKDVVLYVDALRPDGTRVRLQKEELGFGYRESIFQHEPLIITGVLLQLQEDVQEEVQHRTSDYVQRRRDKQPLEMPSAGSVFKRPEGHFAGALIEEAGLKGFRTGGAEVSTKHAGFIVNAGGATATDVVALIRHIQKTVEEASGVHLEPELRILQGETLIRL